MNVHTIGIIASSHFTPAGGGGITYVGGKKLNKDNPSTATMLSVSSGLINGSDSSPSVGDLVILSNLITASTSGLSSSTKNAAGVNLDEISRLYSNSSSADTTLIVTYRFIESSDDLSFVFRYPGFGSGAVMAHVFRGVHASVFDASTVTSQGTTTSVPSPASITTVSAGAVVFVTAAGDAASGATAYTSSDLTNFLSTLDAPASRYGTLGGGYKERPTPGVCSIATFGGGQSGSGRSYASVTVALKPA